MMTNKTRATYVIFGLAVLFNLSNIPGLKTELGSSDQHSFLTCDMENEVRANGVATCEQVSNKIRGNYTVEKVTRQEARPQPAGQQGPPAPGRTIEEYRVTSALEAEFCMDGTCTVTRTARSLEAAIKLGKDLTDEMIKGAAKSARDKREREAKIKRCEMTEDDEPITKEKEVLKCLTGKLASMSGEEAADYYADNLKERIQALLQSNSMADRQLGMGALQEVGKSQNINCASRPGMAATQVSGLLDQTALAPRMNSMQPTTFAASRPGAERNLITESACDLWAFGTYNHNVDYLNFVATQPGVNRAAVAQALNGLKAGWGNYFRQRGMVLQSDIGGLNGFSSELHTDMIENNAKLEANMKAILDRHKELLEYTPGANPADPNATSGRLARGGIPAQNSTGPGTVVNPWPGAPPAPQQPARPAAAPAQPGRFGGAPAMGTPVGGGRGLVTTQSVRR